MWHGTQRFPNYPDSRALQVTAAHIQGYEANITMAEQSVGIRNPNFRRLVFSRRDSPAALPASGLPTTSSQYSVYAEGAQGPLPRPPGMFSVCAPSSSQASAGDSFVQHQSAPAGWPAARGPVDVCQLTGRASSEICAPGPRHVAPRQQPAAERLTAQPRMHAFMGLATATGQPAYLAR
ncbi:unnamed protein product [Prorocentrum cordatum]|uniref:Uncharacterized protein n=1 Tax=Prorocentrum cordatum TaxID=2364126 RepID=A0ABN9U5N3_9DINO|nr:unnamed protein product [Polarella glacialis]